MPKPHIDVKRTIKSLVASLSALAVGVILVVKLEPHNVFTVLGVACIYLLALGIVMKVIRL